MWGDIPAQHQRPRPEVVAIFAGVKGQMPNEKYKIQNSGLMEIVPQQVNF